MRRQGVRADGLLKDGDNLLQRYRNLETRLGDQQSQARRDLEGQREEFHTQAESTQTWIRDLAEGLASPHIQGQHQEVKLAAQVRDIFRGGLVCVMCFMCVYSVCVCRPYGQLVIFCITPCCRA